MTMEKILTNNVNSDDRICASLECNGRRLATINATGFSSMETIKRAMLDLAGRFAGVAVLTVRNCTQGWRDVSALASMRSAVPAMQPACTAPHHGSQYLIPWAS